MPSFFSALFRSRPVLPVLVLLVFSNTSTAQEDKLESDALLYAAAWKQTAAEYRALYHQGFNIAWLRVEQALAAHNDTDQPLAIVTDLDDTLLHALSYWGGLIEQGQAFFDDALWDEWVPENRISASPGALDFLRFCETNGVEVFYVTSRDQGPETYDLALAHLRHLGFPFADEAHLTVLRESSNKEPRQDEIMRDYEVVVFLGDNLNDFRRKYYLRSDVPGRIASMESDRHRFGLDYILFPNPTDGHWLAAIFGESEPAATAANLEILRRAAMRESWVPVSP